MHLARLLAVPVAKLVRYERGRALLARVPDDPGDLELDPGETRGMIRDPGAKRSMLVALVPICARAIAASQTRVKRAGGARLAWDTRLCSAALP